MKKQIVFVLSTNFAGSHFLTLQLASHSRCISVGEFHRFKHRGARRSEACARCDTDHVCPVFKGLPGLPADQLFPTLFNNVHALDPQVETVIDNSKKAKWAVRFLSLPDVEKKYIHLIRDPRALIRRWKITYRTAEQKQRVRRRMARRGWRHAANILTGSEANVYLWKWAYLNKIISDFLRTNELDCKVLTYRELATDRDAVLAAAMNWIGYEFEPGQEEYWRFEHHGSVKPKYMKPPPEDKLTHDYDQRWRDFLDDEAKALALTHPAVNAYLVEAGLVLDEARGLLHT